MEKSSRGTGAVPLSVPMHRLLHVLTRCTPAFLPCSEAQKILPFQVLSTRSRKVRLRAFASQHRCALRLTCMSLLSQGVDIKDIKVQVCFFCFDCLYLNGQSLLEQPLSARRAALYNNFDETTGLFKYSTHFEVGGAAACFQLPVCRQPLSPRPACRAPTPTKSWSF